MTASTILDAWRSGAPNDADLSDPVLRRELYGLIAAEPNPAQFHAPLRCLFAMEVQQRRERTIGDHYENLYFCALLLFDVGDPDDVPLMWRAKQADFDASIGFDGQFLVGAGVQATLQRLHAVEDKDAAAAADYISECDAAGEFDDMATWREWRGRCFLAG